MASFSDEEYRLLRQSLFERFASGDVAPSETPHVPVARSGRGSIDGRGELYRADPCCPFSLSP